VAEGAPAKPKGTPKASPVPRATAVATPHPAAAGAEAAEKPEQDAGLYKVAIASDSTAAEYPDEDEKRGWGQYLQDHFNPSMVKIYNMAKKGRTARGFMVDGIWKGVLKLKPNLVLIEFGHNEYLASGGGDPTDQARELKKFLGAYVDTSEHIGAIPILLTPTAHFNFEDGQPRDKILPFVMAVRQAAESRGVTLIDVYAGCQRMYAKLGEQKTLQLSAHPDEPRDPVHFNPVGAWAVAELVARELTKVGIKELTDAIKPVEYSPEEVIPPVHRPNGEPGSDATAAGGPGPGESTSGGVSLFGNTPSGAH
jgi:lysophospholipase L1-like esterase